MPEGKKRICGRTIDGIDITDELIEPCVAEVVRKGLRHYLGLTGHAGDTGG